MDLETKKIVRIIFGALLLAMFVFFILIFGTNRLPAAMSLAEPTPTSAESQETDPGPTATLMNDSAEETSPPPTEPTPEPTPGIPDIDISSWEFALANGQHSIGDYAPELTEIEGGQYFDTRAAQALEDFIAAARAEGLSAYLSSAYRDFETQKYLYENKVAEYGETIAKTIVAPPGTSEHQLGLAADITDQYYQYKNESLADTDLFKWMVAHCAEYGFILRYPADKTDITGVMYEPWHFRYIGVEAATYIMENGICFEEFLDLYE
ncbi:MAG: D-alanyl-D-alanine carboxypeptidase family protein [Clostridia bacterium]|nr:D-alanyl-D-alanine carboxypeptidase family protein [Clostridia bacterium]NCC69738.1 D-alanyl-D-alanine carboxypeptidase family protein [Clostridia bacterium]